MALAGFHLGTEVLGEDENRVLDDFFCARCPDLMAFLDTDTWSRSTAPPFQPTCGSNVISSPRRTISLPGLDAANLAFEYYSGAETRPQLRQWVLEGIQAVATVQREVMRTILQAD